METEFPRSGMCPPSEIHKPSQIKCGWNVSSFSFHLTSVAPLDPITEVKKQEFFLNFQRSSLSEKDVF